jgi:hypothetical protein
VIDGNPSGYNPVLLSWLGFKIPFESELEHNLETVFTALSEGALFKLSDNGNDVIFDQEGIYRKIVDTNGAVDINGDGEPKGALRILKSLLSERLNPYLSYDGGSVDSRVDSRQINEYQKRASVFLKLSSPNFTKIVSQDDEIDSSNIKAVVLKAFENHHYALDEYDDKYQKFQSLYGEDALKSLSGKDLLLRLFASKDMNVDGLTYNLEYGQDYSAFGGVGGGSAFKYPLFYSAAKKSWLMGGAKSQKAITEEEAIAEAEKVKSSLLNLISIVKNAGIPATEEDYLALESQLITTNRSYSHMWVLKYLHLLFPKVFTTFYSLPWTSWVLSHLFIEPRGGLFTQNGQIACFARELNIPFVFFQFVIYELFPYTSEDDDEEEVDSEEEQTDFDVVTRVSGGENTILYGVPGAGKSYTIQHEYCNDDDRVERVVFHPDYTYSDFVGQIMPSVSPDGSVSYRFSPGPFTKILRKAYTTPDKMFYLVIEEVNRGNAPAIFGDIFQLLDREPDGRSSYQVNNSDIAAYVYQNSEHKVSIPSNMSILCTMNTSDQNVFTLDTAFQRRWNMRLIENAFSKETPDEKKFAEMPILDSSVTWENFVEKINDYILRKNITMTSSEDKRLGTHFVISDDLDFDSKEDDPKASTEEVLKARLHNRKFPEKVIKYLWDDAFKFNRVEIFDLDHFTSLEAVIREFISKRGDERFDIFTDNVKSDLILPSSKPQGGKE